MLVPDQFNGVFAVVCLSGPAPLPLPCQPCCLPAVVIFSSLWLCRLDIEELRRLLESMKEQQAAASELVRTVCVSLLTHHITHVIHTYGHVLFGERIEQDTLRRNAIEISL